MLRIEPLGSEALPITTGLHVANLKLGLFPKLGTGFMRCYQQSFIDSPYAIALVAREDERIVGVIFGTVANAAHYRWVVRNFGWRLGMAGAAALLKRPALAARFVTTRGERYARAIMRRLMPSPAIQAGAGRAPLSVLSHIVTDESVRRCGIGRRLVLAFAEAARRKGARRAVLVTEEGGLGAPFFERIGARLSARRRGQDGLMVREYGIMLGDAAAYERIVEDRRGRSLVRSFHSRPRAARGLLPAAGGGAG